MLRQRIATSVAVLSLGLSLGIGMLLAPDEAHAQDSAVEICREQREVFGEEFFLAIYKSFGGCVAAFSAPRGQCH